MQRPHGSPAARYVMLSCMAVTLLLPVAAPAPAAHAASLRPAISGGAAAEPSAAALTSTVAVSAPALLPTVPGASPVSSTTLVLTATVSATSMATGPLSATATSVAASPTAVPATAIVTASGTPPSSAQSTGGAGPRPATSASPQAASFAVSTPPVLSDATQPRQWGSGPLVASAPIMLPPSGIITTVAGVPVNNSCGGLGGDGGPATQASLGYPHSTVVDAQGNIFISDNAWNRVREVVASTGLITTVAGIPGCHPTGGYSGDGGPATSAQLDNPSDLALDSAGNLYIVDSFNHAVREVIARTGVITTIAGTGTAGYNGEGLPARLAQLSDPNGVAVDHAGNVYIADSNNNRIRKVDATTGLISTVAGTGVGSYNGDGGAATAAQLNQPFVVRLDAQGALYIADTFNARVRKVDTTTGLISTVAGSGPGGNSGDGGAATVAQLNAPRGLAVDARGNLFIADTGNNRVREVLASTGVIIAFAGAGGAGSFMGDGGPATAAQLNLYYGGPSVDAAGNVYIADDDNTAVRVVGGPGSRRLGGGTTPWRPHHSVRLAGGLDLSVDLADGHVDLQASDLTLAGRGPDVALDHTWDSLLAQSGGATTAGQGWLSALAPSISALSGILTGTVVYTDSSGALWSFGYTGTVTAPAPYTAYSAPPGLPWRLAAAAGGYTLTNILTDEALTFDGQGRYLADTDSYGNAATLSYSGTPSLPRAWTNGGGRSLALSYDGAGRLADVTSPLWRSSGGAQGQHGAYSYTAGGQLQTLTRGAGSTDAVTITFGYSGALLTSVTTAAGHTWTLGYDATGRLTSLLSPISGTVPTQAGYTPAYTTTLTYPTGVPAQTLVVVGAGTPGALRTTYTLDVQGQATAVTDGLNNTTSSTYDADHNVLSRTDANGNTTTYGYQYVGPGGAALGLSGSVGLVTQTVRPPIAYNCLAGDPGCPAPAAVVVTATYNASTDLIATSNGNGWLTSYLYDSHHGVVTTTQQLLDQGTGCRRPPCPTRAVSPRTVGSDGLARRGSQTSYTTSGQVSATIDGRGVDAPADGLIIVRPDAALATWTSTYDPATGDLLSTSTPPVTSTRQVNPAQPSTWQLLGNQPLTTSYGYDADGNQTSVTAPNGATTSTGYDHLGRPVRTTLPSVPLYDGTTAAPVQTTAYDAEGNVAQEVDGNGGVTQSSYDPLGRLTASVSPVGGTQLYTATATEKAAEQDAVGNVTQYGYDAAGRLTSMTDPLTGTTLYAYDPAGNTTKTTAPGHLSIEEQAYDAWNQVLSTTAEGPLGAAGPVSTTLFAYDSEGNVLQSQAANGDVTYRQVDGANRVTEVDLAPGANQLALSPWRVQTWSYDDADNLTRSTDGDSRSHSSVYDGANRAVVSYDVGAGGGLITTTPAYDLLGLVITSTTQSGAQPAVVDLAAYNAVGWRTQTQNQYDPAKGAALYTYGYDKAGQQRTQLIGSSAAYVVNTTLDAEGLARSMRDTFVPTSPATATWSYDPDDQPQNSALGVALTAAQRYDGNSRLAHWEAHSTAGATRPLHQSVDYGYAPTGWTTGVTTTGGIGPGVQSDSHDPQGRLTSAQGPGAATGSWAYDKDGNLTQAVSSGVTTTYGYTGTSGVAVPSTWKPGELLWTQAGSATPTVYGYDGSGHTTALSTTSGYSLTLGYDPQGRLAGVHLLQGAVQVTQTQTYNASGLRSSYAVTRTGVTPLTLSAAFLYRDGQVGSLVSISNSVVTTDTFVYDQNGLPLELLHHLAGGATVRYWYVLDGHANVVALTDSSGNVVDSYSYDAWGKPLTTSETVTQPYRYASYWYDTELGWYWVQVRHYSPSLERWLQPDPSRQDGTLSYVYVGDDPVDATDPSGLGLAACGNTSSGVIPDATQVEGSTMQLCAPSLKPATSRVNRSNTTARACVLYGYRWRTQQQRGEDHCSAGRSKSSEA